MSNKCSVCGKGPKMGYNRPNSQHRTKKIIKPNLQRNQNKIICVSCLRTGHKNNLIKA